MQKHRVIALASTLVLAGVGVVQAQTGVGGGIGGNVGVGTQGGIQTPGNLPAPGAIPAPPSNIKAGAGASGQVTGSAEGNAAGDRGGRAEPGLAGQAAGAVKAPLGAESPLGPVGGMRFSREVIGRAVYNRDGEVIGQVRAVESDRLIVSVGSYLGIGSRDIALTEAQLSHGTSGDQRLVTTLSRTELMAAPDVSLNTGGNIRGGGVTR